LSEDTPPLDADAVGAPSEDDLRGVCEDLLRSWSQAYSDKGSIELGREDQVPDAVRFTVVLAFVAHSHHVTTTAADLMHADDYLSAIPLLRLGYESALTAAWAAQSEEAARALQVQFVETAQKLRGNAEKTGWFEGLLHDAPLYEVVDAAPSARGEAARFANLCLALEPHGEWLYTMYRLLSGYSHPSGPVMKAFAPGAVGDSVSLSPDQPDDHRSWWHAAATNLLHAGQALDGLDSSHRRRDLLAQAGEVVGWSEPLRLSNIAAAKVAEARAQR
jgi:hypothetical protein